MFVSTFSGKNVSLLNPDPVDIDIIDIAHGLAFQCRFNGQTSQFYSVAQHSLIVADLVPEPYKFSALMHDSAEAYCGDCVKNLKELLPQFKEVEVRFEKIIATAFDIPDHGHDIIKRADMITLATEKRDLMPNSRDQWTYLEGFTALPNPIQPMDPATAKAAFLMEFYRLSRHRLAA